MGSVKDLTVMEKSTANAVGRGVFHFSDRYSVFDWGEMPDHIPNKGAALCMMSAWNFERLREMDVHSHYRGLLDENGQVKTFDELDQPSNKMIVDLTNVYPPSTKIIDGKMVYDYSCYGKGDLNNYLLPLEIIFRNGFPMGSSVFEKLEKGIISPADLGLQHAPKPGDMLPEPIFDFTTKLEESDRALSIEEARRISALSDADFKQLQTLARKVNEFITERGKQVGLIHFDGKIEAFYFNGLVLCDVVGTFDEDRFMYLDQQVSKEVLRQWYKRNQPEWKEAVDQAKSDAALQGTKDWKNLCTVQPKQLDTEILTLISQVYMAGANLYTGKRIFDAPELGQLIPEFKTIA